MSALHSKEIFPEARPYPAQGFTILLPYLALMQPLIALVDRRVKTNTEDYLIVLLAYSPKQD